MTAAPSVRGTGARVYDVRHVTRYRYEQEVTASYGRAHLVPRDCPGQMRVDDDLVVVPEPTLLRESEDFYGNRSVYVEVLTAHTELVVTATSRVRVHRDPVEPAAVPGLDVPWERAVELVDAELERAAERSWETPGVAAWGATSALTARGGAEELRCRDFRLPSRHVPDVPEVRAFAAEVFTPGRAVGEAVRTLVSRIKDEFAYKPGATSVSTTLGEVLERRAGVCQDFAHLAVGALRSVGLPARYVSGYLETSPPPGRPKLVGSDASHAWVSAYLPWPGWLDLDPTNDKVVDSSYVLTAWGRDYADVPPLKGVIYTEGGKTTLSVAVDVDRVPPEGTDPAR